MSTNDTQGSCTARNHPLGRDGASHHRDEAAGEGGQLPVPGGHGQKTGPAEHGGAKKAPPC